MKNLKNLGKSITKKDQKKINGGMLSARRCPYFNCYCNGTPGTPIDSSNCEGIPSGVVTNSPTVHCPVVLVGGVCYGCV